MPLQEIFSFRLRHEFCCDCGWLDAVRSRHGDRAAASYLRERHPGLLADRDPSQLIANWWPATGRMFYFLRSQTSRPCRFCATDGVFLHTIEAANPDWRSFDGAIRNLLTVAHAHWRDCGAAGDFPLAPQRGGYPQAILLHHVSTGEVGLAVDKTAAHPQPTSQIGSSCLLTT